MSSGDIARRIAVLEGELHRLRHRWGEEQAEPRTDLPVEAVVVHSGEFLAALPATQVAEVTPMPLVSAIPNAPAALRGTVNYRGVLAQVLDLHYLFTGQIRALTPDMRLVMLQLGDQVFALAVDGIETVQSFGEKDADTSDLLSRLPAYVVHALRGERKSVLLIDPALLLAAGETAPMMEPPEAGQREPETE